MAPSGPPPRRRYSHWPTRSPVMWCLWWRRCRVTWTRARRAPSPMLMVCRGPAGCRSHGHGARY
eukprot:7117952-Prymnesium_polylepis.1